MASIFKKIRDAVEAVVNRQTYTDLSNFSIVEHEWEAPGETEIHRRLSVGPKPTLVWALMTIIMWITAGWRHHEYNSCVKELQRKNGDVESCSSAHTSALACTWIGVLFTILLGIQLTRNILRKRQSNGEVETGYYDAETFH